MTKKTERELERREPGEQATNPVVNSSVEVSFGFSSRTRPHSLRFPPVRIASSPDVRDAITTAHQHKRAIDGEPTQDLTTATANERMVVKGFGGAPEDRR